MESWSIEDDGFSFLHSRPFSFGLCNREGPDRVEIFDITRITSHRSAISETTCLCDIFGDDCESPALSSSPPSGSLTKTEEDEFALAYDTPNDSSGSYHTAAGSEQLSDSSDTFEDSKEALPPVLPLSATSPEARGASPLPKLNGTDLSPDPQASPSSPEARGASPLPKPNGTDLSPDPQASPPSAEARGASPLPKPNGTDLSPDPQASPPSAESTGIALSPRSVAPLSLPPEPRGTDISPEHRTAATPHNLRINSLSLEPSCSGLSSEHRSIDISLKTVTTVTPYKARGSSPSPEPRDIDVFYETTATTPSPEDWDILHSPEPRGAEPRITAIPPGPTSPSPELQPRATPSKLEPSVTSLKTGSRPNPPELEITAELPEPEPRTTSPEPEPRALSAEPETRAKYPESGPRAESQVIKPRSISPKLEPSVTSPEPESTAISSKLEPSISSLKPEPRDKSQEIKPNAISLKIELSATSPEPEFKTPSPEPEPSAISPEPEFRNPSPEPDLSAASPEPEFRTPTPEPEPSFISPEPEFRNPSPEPELSAASPEPELRTPSPEPEPSAISPEPEFRNPSPEPDLSAASPEPEFRTPSPEPEPSYISPEPEFRNPCLEPELSAASPEPKFRTPSPEPEPSAISPEPEFRNPSPEPDLSAASPEPEFRTPSPEPEPSYISPEPEFRNPCLEPELSAASPEPKFRTPSPEPEPSAISPEPEFRSPSPEPDLSAASPEPEFRTPSPEPEPSYISPEPEFRNPCPEPELSAASPEPELRTPSPEPEPSYISPEPEFRNPFPETELSAASPEPEFSTPSPEPELSVIAPEPEFRNPSPEPTAASPEPEFRTPSPEPEESYISPEPEFRTPSPELILSAISPKPELRSTYPILNTSPEGRNSANSPKPRGPEVSLEPKATFLSAEARGTVIFPETTTAHSSEPRDSWPTQDPRITDPPHGPRQTNTFPELRSTSLSLESKTATPGLETWCSTASPEPQSTGELRYPTLSAECKNPHLLEFNGPTPEYSETTVVLELGDRDNLLKPTLEPSDTSFSPKHRDKEGGRTCAALANSSASEGLPSAEPLFASETVSIRPPRDQKSQAGPTKADAAAVSEPICGPQEPNVSATSGESPTVHPKAGDSQPHRDKGQREGVEEEHKREEQGGDEGEGNREKASYGEQQVELSFTARNRRAPVSSAPTCREPQTGMPAGCYSDCLLVTEQQQQQNPLRPNNPQKENKVCARKPQLVPRPTKSSTSRPGPDYSSETSSMGSELDEADNEVKWFTDLAFRSLSSPQADYLDVYNSSHRSSTNVSQLSTEDSPRATAWSAYADLRGSTRHEGDSVLHQPPTGLAPNRLDTTRRFEMGSFECVDVALESREELRRGKRTVPKRQIQLKRRDAGESRFSENDEGATDAVSEAPPVQRCSREMLLRQHSTPAAIQEELYQEVKAEPSDRKQKLQKSLSLDETSSKTKNASCLIKSVLSKKMQHNENLPISQPPLQSGDSSTTVGKNASSESSLSVRETPKIEGSNVSSELPSDCSLSEEDLPLQVEPAPQSNSVKQHRSFDQPKPLPKPLCRHGYSPLQSGASSLELQKNNTGKPGMRSELVIPFESPKTEKRSGRQTWKQSSRETEKQRSKEKEKKSDKETAKQSNKEMEKQSDSEWKQSNRGTEKQRGRDGVKQQTNESLCEKHSGDSANAISGKTGPAATRAPSARSGMTNTNQECYARSENYKQQSGRNLFMSKTQEIMLKPCTTREKKNSSLKVDCLPGDLEPKQVESPGAPSPESLPEKEKENYKMENRTEEQTERGVAFDKNKPKAPVHKVRDVRKLVKNTYNLSFKASAVLAQDSVSRAEVEKPPPMQIEYMSRKVASRPGERQAESHKVQATPQVPAKVHQQESPQMSAQVTPQVPVQVNSQVTPQLPTPVPLRKGTQTASLHITPRGRLTEAAAATLDTAATEANTPGVSESGGHNERVLGGSTRHPKLGSTPKLPSRERELSTLMYLQNGPPEGGLEPGALPPLGLTATSCSRSVSMLLKEKGFQADIGVCDAPADDPSAALKHINRLEVPLQTCSTEGAPSEPHRQEPSGPVPPPVRTSPSAPTPREDPHPSNPTPSESREMDLKPRESNTRAQDSTRSSPQTPAAPATSRNRPQQLTDVTTVSTCTKKPAAAGTGTPSCKQQSASAATAMQLHSDTQKSTVLTASSKMSPPAVSSTSSYKQKTLPPSSPQQPTHSEMQERVTLVSSCSSSCSQSSATTAVQSPSCSQQPAIRTTSTKRTESNNLRYYASDDPPSYDERESFSPLLLTDLQSRKLNRYHPPIQAPPCSCAADGVSSPGPPDLTLSAPGPSSAQALPSHTQAPPSLAAPPPARHHQQRSDARSLSYKSGSPKAAQPSLPQAPHLFQSLHHQPPCLPAFPPPLQQPRPENSRQPPLGQQADRRSGHHRSPQQPAPLSGSSPYSGHPTHSPGVPPLEVRPQYLCSPQGFVSPFGSEFGGEGGGGGGMLYPEGGGSLGYGQSPRRVLLDPETGKYFYIEVPVQPLRKMLFDPETGQYVEVLIPQQTLPHSGMYPPIAAPYPSIHNPGMYAPQYLPYSVPPHSQPPSPRHPEATPPQGLHQNSGGFGTPSNQSPKSEPQNHAPLDQSYLESMYYIPTGMTASPNPAPPEFYHKLPPSLSNSGGKRS